MSDKARKPPDLLRTATPSAPSPARPTRAARRDRPRLRPRRDLGQHQPRLRAADWRDYAIGRAGRTCPRCPPEPQVLGLYLADSPPAQAKLSPARSPPSSGGDLSNGWHDCVGVRVHPSLMSGVGDGGHRLARVPSGLSTGLCGGQIRLSYDEPTPHAHCIHIRCTTCSIRNLLKSLGRCHVEPSRAADPLTFRGVVDPLQKCGVEPHVDGGLSGVLIGNRRGCGSRQARAGNEGCGLLFGISRLCGVGHLDSHCPPSVYTSHLRPIVARQPPWRLSATAPSRLGHC